MKRTIILTTIIASLLISLKSNAQVDTAWTRMWDSQYWDQAQSITTDDLNNIYVAGWSYEWGINYDFIFAKYDAGGNLKWSKIRDYASGDQASHIMIGPDGYLYIAGFVYGVYSTTGGNMCLMKYTLQGDSVWEFVDNNFGLTQVTSMAFDNSGNIILAGFIGAGLGSADYLTMKIDTGGNQQWYQTFNNYGPNQSNRIYGMCVDALDNIYVTGACDDTTYFSTDVFTIKYKPNGDTSWLRRFNAPSNNYDLAEKIMLDPNGDLIIGGRISTSGPAQTDYMLMKYDTAGNLQWTKYFNYPGPQSFDIFNDMRIDPAGNIYLVGNSSTNNAQNTIRVEIIKFNNNGDTIWTARWGNASGYMPQQMQIDDESNIYIAGFYYDNLTSTGYNSFVIKYDSSGVLIWETIYKDSTNLEEEFYSLALDANNDVIATGRKHSTSTFDFATVKYKNSISGISPVESTLQEAFLQCYPNPFRNSVYIKYYLPEDAYASLKIFDMLGNEIKVIAEGRLHSGYQTLQFKDEALKAGVYICKLVTCNKQYTQKLIITK